MSDLLVSADAVRTPDGVTGNAVLVDNGMVAAVGDVEELRAPGIREERFPGRVIVPGLRDAHFHPVGYTAGITGISLKPVGDIAELIEVLGAGAAALSPGEPLEAIRLDDEGLAEGRYPTREELDSATGDRPALLHRYCGHVAVANSAALALANISPATPDPTGGGIDRDEAGEPTGVLRETAVDLVATKLQRTAPVTPQLLISALQGLAGLGLTSIGAIVGCGDGLWATLGDETKLLAEVAAELPIRVNVLVIANDHDTLEAAASRLTGAGDRLRFLGLKRFADGSLGGHTAAMHSEFNDAPTTGTLRLDPKVDGALARHALDLGGRVATHAIGDRAIAAVLDLYQTLLDEGADAGRLRIEHVSVIDRADIARMGDLEVTASVQPAFMGSETEWLERRVGGERLPLTYPFRSLADAGVPLAGGSDCPVEPPYPLSGIALARDRAGIYPAEALSAAEALSLFTTGAARAMGEPEPLVVGSPADFVVLDHDPVMATPDEVRTLRVAATWVGGEEIVPPEDWAVWTG